MRFTEKQPDLRRLDQAFRDLDARTTRISGDVNDRKTREAHNRQRQAMKTVQLGGLSNAVKAQVGRGTDRRGNPNAFGVIFIDDGDDSRAAGAIEAYTEGATISPVKGPWLWYQTDKLARTSKLPTGGKRGRLTPERYAKMGNPLGPLRFARLSPRFAKLYVDVADVAVKTGRATRPGKRMSRNKVRMQRVTLFYGIKQTRRARRYDPQRISRQAHGEIPAEIARDMAAAFNRG